MKIETERERERETERDFEIEIEAGRESLPETSGVMLPPRFLDPGEQMPVSLLHSVPGEFYTPQVLVKVGGSQQ